MERSAKMVMVLALMLATAVVSLEGRQLKAEAEPQTFPGFPGGAGTGSFPNFGLGQPALGGRGGPPLGAGTGSFPNFGLGQPALGGGGGGQPLFGSTPSLPGFGPFGSTPSLPGFGGVPGIGQP